MPSVTVDFPAEIGGRATVNMREGESPQDAIDRRMASIKAQPQYSGVSDSDWTNFISGIGQGMTNVGRQLGNMASIIPGVEGYSDEELAESRELDAPLLDTKAGFTGSMVGEIAATAPLGLGAGGLAAKAAPALGKTMARRAAMQGATEGAIVAGPDNRMLGAGLGGGLGGGLTKTLQGMKRFAGTSKKGGLLGKISDEASVLQDEIDQFIPLSHALPQGTAKKGYEGIVANLPISGGMVRSQFDEAVKAFSREAAEQSLPPTSIPNAPVLMPDDIHPNEAMDLLNTAWDKAWDVINNLDMVMLKGHWKAPHPNVTKALAQSEIPWPKVGETVNGRVLRNTQEALQDLINENTGRLGGVARSRLLAAKTQIDDIITVNVGTGEGVLAKTWKGLKSEEGKLAYRKYLDFKKSAPGNVSRKITPATIEKASASRAGAEGLKGEGALQDFGERGARTLKSFSSEQGVFQMGAATGALSGAIGLLTGGVGGILPAIAIGLTAASQLGRKGVQEYLTAQLGSQKAVTAFLRKHKSRLEAAGIIGRAGAVTSAIGEQ